MTKGAAWLRAFKAKLFALRAKLAKALSLTSSVPNAMGREEADQTNARLKAMHRHPDSISTRLKRFAHLKAAASQSDLDSINSEHWFEKSKPQPGETNLAEGQVRVTKNRLMSQSKMTNTRLNAYIDTIKQDTDNEIDGAAHSQS